MATFEVQVESLTGLDIGASTFPDQDNLTQYLIDGVLDVTEKWLRRNPQDKERFMTVTAEGASQGVLSTEAQIVSVVRESGTNNDWIPCKKIGLAMQGPAANADSIYLASANDPVFAIESNGVVNVYPAPSATTNAYKVYYVNNEPVDEDANPLTYADDGIKFFPKGKIPLVVMNASMKCLLFAAQYLQTSLFTGTITNALSYANQQIDAIIAGSGPIDKIILEVTEAVSLTDSAGSGIQFAVDGMATAVAKFRADGGDPVLFGDETQYETGEGMTRVKAALDNAEDVINSNEPSSTTDAFGAQANEDIELVTSALSIASQEIARADAHISEFNAAADNLVKEIEGFGSEAGSRISWIDSKSTVWNGWSTEISSRLETAAGYMSEAGKRMEIYSKQYEWYLNLYNEIKRDYIAAFGIETKEAQ